MPRLIFDKVTGVPEKLHLDVTVACSPLLSFKRRKTRTEVLLLLLLLLYNIDLMLLYYYCIVVIIVSIGYTLR